MMKKKRKSNPFGEGDEMEISLLVLIFAIILFSVTVIHIQAKQIDRLTDRLMARSYVEYVSMQPKPETPQTPRREPLSWYDDADIEERD